SGSTFHTVTSTADERWRSRTSSRSWVRARSSRCRSRTTVSTGSTGRSGDAPRPTSIREYGRASRRSPRCHPTSWTAGSAASPRTSEAARGRTVTETSSTSTRSIWAIVSSSPPPDPASPRRSSMIIGLASPGIASSIDDGLGKIERLLAEASAQGAEIVCFPEAYLPGLRGQDFEVLPFDQPQQERLLQAVRTLARAYAVAIILGTERLTEAGRQIAAVVFDARGEIQGYQTKNQPAPTQHPLPTPGNA